MRAWREEAEQTKDAEETEETKDAEDTEETEDAKETGETKDAEDTKEAEDTEETEDAKETWDAEGADCRDSRSAIQPLVFAEPLSPRYPIPRVPSPSRAGAGGFLSRCGRLGRLASEASIYRRRRGGAGHRPRAGG